MDSGISPNMPEKSLTIGEEFIEWAEKYWDLQKAYGGMLSSEGNTETCPYSYIADTFSKKIDNLISERLAQQL